MLYHAKRHLRWFTMPIRSNIRLLILSKLFGRKTTDESGVERCFECMLINPQLARIFEKSFCSVWILFWKPPYLMHTMDIPTLPFRDRRKVPLAGPAQQYSILVTACNLTVISSPSAQEELGSKPKVILSLVSSSWNWSVLLSENNGTIWTVQRYMAPRKKSV